MIIFLKSEGRGREIGNWKFDLAELGHTQAEAVETLEDKAEDTLDALRRRFEALEGGNDGGLKEGRPAPMSDLMRALHADLFARQRQQQPPVESIFIVNQTADTPALLFDAATTEATLMAAAPVVYSNPNKALVASLCYPGGTQFLDSPLRITRWDSGMVSNPKELSHAWPEVHVVTTFFEYTAAPGFSPWYPNFAHTCLFTAWDSDLLAQDELQV